MRAAYELYKSQRPIGSQQFADVIECMRVTEEINKYYGQVDSEIKNQFKKLEIKEYGADALVSVSAGLLREHNSSTVKLVGDNLSKMNDLFEKTLPGDQLYFLVTLLVVSSANASNQEEPKKEEQKVIEEIIRKDRQENQSKTELVQRLKGMAAVYQNLKADKGKHSERIQDLIKKVEIAPSYGQAMKIVEASLIQQKKRYEQGRAFSTVFNKIGLSKLFKFNFEKKITKEDNSFFSKIAHAGNAS